MDKKLKYSIPSFDELVNKTTSEIVATFKGSGLKFPKDKYRSHQKEKEGETNCLYVMGSNFTLCYMDDYTFSVHKKEGRFDNLELHNPVGPAFIVFSQFDSIFFEYYYIDNTELGENDFMKYKAKQRIKSL